MKPRRCLPALLWLFLLPPALPHALASEEAAENISGMDLVIHAAGIENLPRLFDGNTTRALSIPDGAEITLSHPDGIGSAYLIFDTEFGPYTVSDPDTGESHTFGEQDFLHEYLDLEGAFQTPPRTVVFTFPGGARLNELYLFSPGEPPDFVQQWELPKEGKTDLLLFSTHGDDEQLFFAGLLPCYAGQRNYEVLVAYLTDHHNLGTLRRHEMLDGLWAVGVTTYPIFGPFGDFYSHTSESAYAAHQRAGETQEALLGYVVEQLRRFRPQVAVGHDVNGEYGHGQHKMYAELLCRAVEAAADPEQYPQLTDQWGVWEVPKTYLHLWPENRVTMNWDVPLERFGGMTAFQVSQQLGFPCHRSQYGGFTWYIAGYEQASAIPKYSPCEYGLYRSTVGPDVEADDFFENLTSYADHEALAAMAELREQARQARESAIRASLARQHRAEVREELRRAQLQAEAAARQAQSRQHILFAVFSLTAIVVSAIIFRRKKNIR